MMLCYFLFIWKKSKRIRKLKQRQDKSKTHTQRARNKLLSRKKMQFKFFSNPNFARCLYSVNECVSLCDRRVLLKLWNFIFRETICAKHIETQGNILNYKADAQCDLYFLRILFIHNTYVRTSHGRKWMNGQSAMISLLRSTNLDECEHGRFH